MSKYLEKYLNYQKEWSELAFNGKMQEYRDLVKKAKDECYPNFDEEDWNGLIRSTNMVQAQIAYDKLKKEYLKNKKGESEKR